MQCGVPRQKNADSPTNFQDFDREAQEILRADVHEDLKSLNPFVKGHGLKMPSAAVVPSPKKSDSPYQLDPDQTLRASSALLQHLKKEAKRIEEASSKKNLLAGDDEDDDDSEADTPANDTPVWLLLTTKQHMVDKSRLKPGKIQVPHSLNKSASLSICLITADPQRAVKDVVADPSFPSDLASKITRIIGYSKLKARYHSFESRRQLLNDHDVFLADDRIILRLIETLGKTFYKSQGKRPIPIRIAGFEKDPSSGKTVKSDKVKTPNVIRSKDEPRNPAAVASPSVVAAEIQRTLSSIPISIKPGASASVRVGKQSFTATQLSENIDAVVKVMTEKYIVKGWRNVKAIHIKGPNTAAMPIWLSDELWVDESQDVLPDQAIATAETGGDDEPVKQIEGVENGTAGTKRKAKHQPDKSHPTKKKAVQEEKKKGGAERKSKLKAMKEKAMRAADDE